MKTMKCLLLTVFFISMGWVCKAQGFYELHISYNLHNDTKNDCTCDSKVRITVHFKNKTQKEIKYRMLTTKAHQSYKEELWYVFPTSNEIEKIEFYTRRDYDKGLFNKCQLSSDGVWTISNITYPEFTAYGTNANIHGYGNSWSGSTSASIRITPLTNKKLLTLNMNLLDSRDFEFYYYEASIIKFDGTETFLSPLHDQDVPRNRNYGQTSYFVKDVKEMLFDISKIRIDLYRTGISGNKQSTDLSFANKAPPVEVKSSITDMQGLPIFTAQYRVVYAPLKVQEGDILTDVGNMTLEAAGGFPENSISWAYYVGELPPYPVWKRFPDGFQKKNKITFTTKDIGLTDAQMGEKIHFVYRVGTDWSRESEAQTFTLMKKAPEMIGYRTANPTCSYLDNGSITVQFDRDLTEKEILKFDIKKDGEPLYVDQNMIISKLAEDRRHTFENLPHGKYSISYNAKKDGKDEAASGAGYQFDNLEIISPPNIAAQYKKFDVNCYSGHDGRIAVDASGGTGPYRIEYSEKWMPQNEMITPFFTDRDTVNDLKPGAYTLRISDSNRCYSMNEAGEVITAEQIIAEQSAGGVILTIAETVPPLGFGLTDGTISVQADRGTPGYGFIWKKNGEDFDAHTESPPFSAAVGTVGDGLYHIRVQDGRYAAAMKRNPDESNIRGCYDTLSVRIVEPPKLEVKLATLDSILCHGDANGSIVARAWGGVPYDDEDAPYRYEWSELRPYQDDRDTILKELPAGAYTVTVMDGNGITGSFTYMLPQPDVLQAGATGNTILCDGDADGRMEATARGGTTPYRYEWASAYAQVDGNTSVMENLTGGKYSVKVTDYHNCITAAFGAVSVPDGMQTPDTVTVPPACHDADGGSIALQVTGGAGGYRYLWNTGATAPNLSGIPAGRYSVRVTDANNCFIERHFSLANPEPLLVNIGPDRTLCREQSVVLSAAIPDPGASYGWYNRYGLFSEEPEVEVLTSGEYRVAVADGKGCTGEDTVTVTVSDVEITADFVAAEKAACTVPACFVNISDPAPDRVEWLIPDDPEVTVIRQDDEQVEVRFNREGVYRVGLRSQVGDCEKTAYRDITVVGKYDLGEYEPQQEAFLKQFKLWPNPNSGQFTVLAELSETAGIELRLVNTAGTVIETRSLKGQDRYEEVFSTAGKLNPGLYILQLVSEKAVAGIQVVID
jgi:hypothetical protein